MFTSLRRFAKKKSLRAISILTFFMFASRGLGLIRNLLIYQRFSGLDADVLLAATKIPDLLVSLLVMGTISSSVLPVASRLETNSKYSKNNDSLSRYINLVYISIIGVLFVVSIMVVVFTPWFLEITTSNSVLELFQENKVYTKYVTMTRILMLGPLAFATQGVFGVYLTLKERFTVYSWAGAIYNVGMIIGILLFPLNYFAPAIGMMSGAAVNSLLYVIDAKRGGLQFISEDLYTYMHTAWREHAGNILSTWKSYIPRIFIINGLVGGNLLINTVASNQGQIFAVDLALSIQGVFFSVITAASTVFFPNISKTFHNKAITPQKQWKRLFYLVERVGIVAILGTVATVLFTPAVMWIFEIFGRGQDNASYIITITRVSAIAIVFQSLVEILSKYIYTKERVWQPVVIYIVGFVVQLLITYTCVYMLTLDAGLSVSIGVVGNFVIIFLYMLLVTMRDREFDIHRTPIVTRQDESTKEEADQFV